MFQDFLKNQVRHFSALSLEKLPPETIRRGRGVPPITPGSGVEVQENGDVSFKIYAPTAEKGEISFGRRGLSLEKGEDGLHRGSLPFDPHFCGLRCFDVMVDGVLVLYPYAPISWHLKRQRNFVEIPDPGTEYRYLNRVPHGAVSTEIYWSEEAGRHLRCLVYTPPGYRKGTEDYPVLYLQHGATENETCWVYDGKAGLIMDNLLAAGEVRPFLIVMNNGEVVEPEHEGTREMDDLFERVLLHDCIPYIEANYRVKADKWHRAMAGLSMGSMQTSRIGLTHPEVFSYLGVFSGFLRFGSDHATQDDSHLSMLFDRERFLKEYKLLFRSVGEEDDNMMDCFTVDETYVERAGLRELPNYVCKTYPLQQHEWGAWYRAFRDFAPLLFKD